MKLLRMVLRVCGSGPLDDSGLERAAQLAPKGRTYPALRNAAAMPR